MDFDAPSITITRIRSFPMRSERSQLDTDIPMEEARMRHPVVHMPDSLSARSTPRYTAREIFMEFSYRRVGLIRALAKGEALVGMQPLYLYGNTDGSWELRAPKPKELLGINLVKGNMKHIKWLQHIAMHGDAWLINISFSLSQHLKPKEREDLFNMINSMPTIYETLQASVTYQRICHLEEKEKEKVELSRPVIEKNNQIEDDDEVLSDLVTCPICEGHYNANAFWICCDVCNEWYHGKCVKITAKKANYIKQFECPECLCDRRGHN